MHASPGPASELLRGGFGTMQDSRDVSKRHAEHVVQHKRQPLGGIEHVEHDEQRKPDRVGNQGLSLGVSAVFACLRGDRLAIA